MTDTEAWVEVKLWIVERGNRSQLRFRGKLRELDLNREVVVLNFDAANNNYLPAGREGTLRWVADDWKMDHGSPAGYYPPLKSVPDTRGDDT